MNNYHDLPVKLIKTSYFWLLTLATSLVVIYMTLLSKAGDTAHLGMSGLFLLVVGSLIWEKRHSLKLESHILSKLLGVLIIGLLLFKLPLSPHKTDLNPYLRISPFMFGLGLSLIASGVRGLKQYWRELIILFFLGIPSLILSSLTNPSEITAKFSAFILECLNYDVSLQGIHINLPTGGVTVVKGCSGLEAMAYLLGIAAIVLTLFPLRRIYNLFVPIVAVIVGFVVNAVRVALMAILVASDQLDAFDYWHEGEGSLIFGMLAVVIFIGFYFLLIRFSKPQPN
ncbi:cyanoexosortase A [Gloeothece verrucosa]|uniref:Exosortase EpsH-related protein n=1 Tax=Gloeothece verrucosa (strain PCC 7822) TaxID=497965 RepID=E0UBR2_GLOV7|nr:cyanoexosortase A [Gloeothece verrucosa]ADN14006.1 Exosortase EpsH-related protein [Gloeothece verrucosa PCC 7822]